MRQAFGRGFYLGGALAGAMTATQGQASRRETVRPSPTPSSERPHATAPALPGAGRQAHLRQALDASISRATGRGTTQPNHLRVRTRAERRSRSCGSRCARPTCTRPARDGGDGRGRVTPSNCVQCGAITAKGGRLTPPEGGSGPEYTVT